MEDKEVDKGLIDDMNHEAVIQEDNLDAESTYSHLYLTSVYHDDVSVLHKALKTRYYQINHEGKTTLDQYLEKESKSFDEQFDALGLEEERDDEDVVSKGNEEKKDRNDLFLYALSVAVLSCTIQCTFIITIIKEYIFEDMLITTDPELITIRILAFTTITLKVWIEFCNGRKILMQGIYHSYMFRSNGKRIISSIMGGVQIFTALACYFCSSELVVRTQGVNDCVKDFSSLIIITEIDNWIGDYFMSTNKEIQLYSNDNVKIITVSKRRDYGRYTFADAVIDFILFATFVVSIIPIYNSVTFDS